MGGIIKADKISCFPALFFGICSIIFIYMYFNPQKESVNYDKMFLSESDEDRLEYSEWGFFYPGEKYKFYWHKIHSIIAFKRDLITYDDICLTIEHEFDVLTISESFPGWQKIKNEIENRFNITDLKWFEKMANHAFVNNEIILYKKQMAN